SAALSDAGTLTVNGGSTLTDAAGFSIASGGTLKGTGTVAANVSNGGTVAPGNSPGVLTITGNYTQTSGRTLNIELQGTNPGAPGTTLLWTGGSGDWNTPASWYSVATSTTGSLPGASDVAFIGGAGSPTVSFTSGTAQVTALVTDAAFTSSGGSLTVGGSGGG